MGKMLPPERAKMTHNYQFQSVTLTVTVSLYISRPADHIINIFGTQV